MKKEIYVWLLLPLLWCFWFFGMKGHIGYWEGTDFFQSGLDYWKGFACKPGGWSEYLGNLLTQFYQWTWVGASVITLVSWGIFTLVRGIVRIAGVKKFKVLISIIPLVLVTVLQGNEATILGDLLKVFFFYLLLWGYFIARLWKYSRVFFTLGYLLAFFLLGGAGAGVLFVAKTLGEIIGSKGRQSWLWGGAWLVLAVVFPLLWKEWGYVMLTEDIYRLSGPDAFLLWNIYGYGVLLPLIFQIGNLKQDKTKSAFYYAEMAFVVVLCLIAVYNAYNRNGEFYFRMEQAAIKGKWEQVLQMAEQVDNTERENMYLISLALANRGELGERLFDYPVWGIGCLYLPRELDYKSGALGGEMYYRLKIPNEALHWTFQASVASPQGMDFRTLRRLIDLNLLKRDSILADKYLSVMENTLGHDSWCRAKRSELQDAQRECVLADHAGDFFIGGRPFLSDMARVLDAGRSKEMALDYILCGLLLNKDLKKFCQLFITFYPAQEKRIPKAYQEALVVAMTVDNPALRKKGCHIDADILKRFEDYNAFYRTANKNKQQASELMKNFKDTWWYYFHFTDTRLMDEKGHVVGGAFSL